MEEADKRLLEPAFTENGQGITKKRRMEMIRPVVPWLQKTKYVTGLSDESKKPGEEKSGYFSGCQLLWLTFSQGTTRKLPAASS